MLGGLAAAVHGPGPFALVPLEHIGTPEAMAILKDMGTGHPEAQRTRVARKPLDRLAAKAR